MLRMSQSCALVPIKLCCMFHLIILLSCHSTATALDDDFVNTNVTLGDDKPRPPVVTIPPPEYDDDIITMQSLLPTIIEHESDEPTAFPTLSPTGPTSYPSESPTSFPTTYPPTTAPVRLRAPSPVPDNDPTPLPTMEPTVSGNSSHFHNGIRTMSVVLGAMLFFYFL